jgi:hypothetical protein
MCMAVGTGISGSFAERWNGRKWSLDRLPLPLDGVHVETDVYGISCATPLRCMIVGFYVRTHTRGQPHFMTFAAKWNGQRWSLALPPNPSKSSDSELIGVSCPVERFCIAVGSAALPSSRHTLIERWNGSRWNIVPSPNPTRPKVWAGARLNSVSCPDRSYCVATGNSGGAGPTVQKEAWQVSATLAERWTSGVRWTSWSSARRNPSRRSPLRRPRLRLWFQTTS